jgi:hypothetical protein
MPLGLFDRPPSCTICDQPKEAGVRHRIIDSTRNTVPSPEPDLHIEPHEEAPLGNAPSSYSDGLLIRFRSRQASFRAALGKLPLDNSVHGRILSLSTPMKIWATGK